VRREKKLAGSILGRSIEWEIEALSGLEEPMYMYCRAWNGVEDTMNIIWSDKV